MSGDFVLLFVNMYKGLLSKLCLCFVVYFACKKYIQTLNYTQTHKYTVDIRLQHCQVKTILMYS